MKHDIKWYKTNYEFYKSACLEQAKIIKQLNHELNQYKFKGDNK